MTDLDAVRRQYATEQNLQTRQSVWHPTADGRDAACEALAAIVDLDPATLLEVGCGTGGFAARIATALPACRVVALDQSERFVGLTASRGLVAEVGDVQDLASPDATFDVVVAMWMLYHLPDLDRGLAEIRRVLRPGGTLVAVTNGDEHVADLRRDAGGGPVRTTFSSENGEESLHRHFANVTREDLRPRAVFADHASAVAYLESSREDVVWVLPPFEGPREYAGAATVFVAH